MRVVGLISGGKDSCFNMMQCVAAGHEIVALANLTPESRSEIDSYMFQSVGFEAIDLIAEAMELPLYRRNTKGTSLQRGRTYEPCENDEVEDLFDLLKWVKEERNVDAVSVGAILSDYQRIRVENICIRLGLTCLAYLWQRNQQELLKEMSKCEIDAVVIKVAALGLEPSRHLGRPLRLLEAHLEAMHEKYGLNVCGEGGEYETLTVDCPLYKSRIVIEESEVVLHSNDPIAPVGYLKLNKLKLDLKLPVLDLKARFNGLPLKDSDGYVSEDDAPVLVSEEEVNEDISCNKEGGAEVFDESIKDVKSNSGISGDGWLWIGGLVGKGNDPKSAVEMAMDSLTCVLEKQGKTSKDICSISMYIANMDDFAEINKAYCGKISSVNPPTRACVQVPLPDGCSVILEAVAWSALKSPATGDSNTERITMHVQSVSHWAPANIGPYSQAVRVGDLIHLAGQIGLVPGSMQMVEGGIKRQCQLALRHVGRLLKAMDPNVNLRDVVQGICYVSDIKFIDHARKLWEEKTNNAIVDYVVVSGLPRSALIEWHVWAHRHNNQFEYEETGKCVEDWSISIYRRWNYENNTSAIVCHLQSNEETALTSEIFKETLDYAVHKLQQGHEGDASSLCAIKVFYPSRKGVKADVFLPLLEDSSLVFTVVPACLLHNEHTYLSICGIRNQ